MSDPDRKAMREYRRKYFAVRIEEGRYFLDEGEVLVSITSNGKQWQSLGLYLDDEVPQVIAALQRTQIPQKVQ